MRDFAAAFHFRINDKLLAFCDVFAAHLQMPEVSRQVERCGVLKAGLPSLGAGLLRCMQGACRQGLGRCPRRLCRAWRRRALLQSPAAAAGA